MRAMPRIGFAGYSVPAGAATVLVDELDARSLECTPDHVEGIRRGHASEVIGSETEMKSPASSHGLKPHRMSGTEH